jgi:predicted protein tyrosine phosphatase
MFSNFFSTKSNLAEVFANYHNVPMFVIRFAMLIYQKKSEDVIFDLIINNSRDCENLMDCVITSSKLKLCDIPIMKVLCKYKCICGTNISYDNLFDKMLIELKNNYNVVNKHIFSINLGDLIKNTDVYNNKFKYLVESITKSDSKYHNAIIELIANAELFNNYYYQLVEYIEENAKNRIEIYKCYELKDTIKKHINQCSYIKNNVYVSNFKFANNVASVRENEFEYIITICKKNIIRLNDIKNYIIPVPDTDEKNFVKESKKVLKVMKGIKNKKILCHCNMGVSRSVIFTALLFHVRNKMKFDTALQLIKDKRYIANPNPKIVEQVRENLSELESF